MLLRKIGKITIVFILIVILFFVVFLSIKGSEVTKTLCRSEVKAKINDVINQSNDRIVNLDMFYSDFFTVQYSSEQKVSSITANVGLINQLTLIWNTEIQKGLDRLRDMRFDLSLGTMTGNAFFSNYGATLSVKCQVVSNCAITYSSKFISAGINQTLHRLIMYTEVIGDIIIPGNAGKVEVNQEIVLAETIISGDIPDSYLIGEGSLNYLDLIP